jgi:hypothetical protein
MYVQGGRDLRGMQELMKKMTVGEAVSLALLSGLLGLLLFHWPWFAKLLGFDLQIERSGSIITVEYLWGAIVVLGLGLAFHKHPIWCAIWFMFGPVLVTHPIQLMKLGRIPNLWPMEILMLAVLTLPYIGIALGAAYVRKRMVETA